MKAFGVLSATHIPWTWLLNYHKMRLTVTTDQSGDMDKIVGESPEKQ